MTNILIEGAIGGAVLSLIAFLLSRFAGDIIGRTLLASVLFAAAGAYLGFAFQAGASRIWLLIELLQCIAIGTLGLIGWRGDKFATTIRSQTHTFIVRVLILIPTPRRC